jgi:acetoin utilization protein AcuB
MTREVVVVPPELRLSDAWEIMKRRKIHHLPVVRGGRLLGMLSDRDVLLRAHPGPQDEPLITTRDLVAAAMTPAPYVCGPSTHIDELVHTMTEKHIHAIPVVGEEDKLVGLVTATDLLLLLLSTSSKDPVPFEFTVRETGVPPAPAERQ